MSNLQEGTQEVQEVAVAPKPVVRISDCKRMLKEGMDRKAIAAHYGIPASAMAEKVWSHPELKGLKTKKIYDIELIDDTVTEEVVAEEIPVVAEVIETEEVVTTTEANVAFSDMQAEVGETAIINDWGN